MSFPSVPLSEHIELGLRANFPFLRSMDLQKPSFLAYLGFNVSSDEDDDGPFIEFNGDLNDLIDADQYKEDLLSILYLSEGLITYGELMELDELNEPIVMVLGRLKAIEKERCESHGKHKTGDAMELPWKPSLVTK